MMYMYVGSQLHLLFPITCLCFGCADNVSVFPEKLSYWCTHVSLSHIIMQSCLSNVAKRGYTSPKLGLSQAQALLTHCCQRCCLKRIQNPFPSEFTVASCFQA
eukprot:c17828_g1_i2 orf=510-818(-)